MAATDDTTSSGYFIEKIKDRDLALQKYFNISDISSSSSTQGNIKKWEVSELVGNDFKERYLANAIVDLLTNKKLDKKTIDDAFSNTKGMKKHSSQSEQQQQNKEVTSLLNIISSNFDERGQKLGRLVQDTEGLLTAAESFAIAARDLQKSMTVKGSLEKVRKDLSNRLNGYQLRRAATTLRSPSPASSARSSTRTGEAAASTGEQRQELLGSRTQEGHSNSSILLLELYKCLGGVVPTADDDTEDAAAASASASASPSTSTSEDGFDSWREIEKRVAIMMALFDIETSPREQGVPKYILTAKGDNHKPEGNFSRVRGNDIPGGIIINNNDRSPCSKIRGTVYNILKGTLPVDALSSKKLDMESEKTGGALTSRPTADDIKAWKGVFDACKTVRLKAKTSEEVVPEKMTISTFITQEFPGESNNERKQIFEAMGEIEGIKEQSFFKTDLENLKRDLYDENDKLAGNALAKIHCFLLTVDKDYKNLNLPASTVRKLLKLDDSEAWQGTAGFKIRCLQDNTVARRVDILKEKLSDPSDLKHLGDAINWLKERGGNYSDDLQDSGWFSCFRKLNRNTTNSSISAKIDDLLTNTPVNLNPQNTIE